MKTLFERWQQVADKMNCLKTRERALIALSILLGIYLIWDFGFYQPLTKKREDMELRLGAAQKDLVKLSAEEKVFTQTLRNDPGAAKKREIMRLEQELKTLDEDLQQLAVGLIAAEKLSQVLYEVLQKSSSLKFIGMQTHPVELLSFNKVLASLKAEQQKTKEEDKAIAQAKAVEQQHPEELLHQTQVGNKQAPEREVGVFKHAVTVSFEGNYFAVIRYLKSLENLEWKIYWDKLDYKVVAFPRARITLEVFTLSTQQGVLGAGI